MEEQIDSFLQKAVAEGHIPGAVLQVAHQGQLLYENAVGYRACFPERLPMQLDTVFDLASLTKVVATLPAALQLMERGQMALDDPVDSIIPQFGRHHAEKVRIGHLLTHTSGLHADFTSDPYTMTKEQMQAAICQLDLLHTPGAKVIYSDLGMMLLAKVIEALTDMPFDRYVRQAIFEPLEMEETCFNPTFAQERYAATEFCQRRGAYKAGIVHDEKADAMGGVSGHAGLFSTVADLSRYACMWKHDGLYRGRRILSKTAIRTARRNFTAFDAEYRGLGWLLKSPTGPSSSGDFMSAEAYGHTGFTGTSIWFDPQVHLHVILLTNRVHFGRHDHILRLRPRLHNLIRASLS
ncbi:UNVERIFIED_CONTAM: CubicO group peptidase (beta-lactamase class C family) [Brevibacillus sp. OAP136]